MIRKTQNPWFCALYDKLNFAYPSNTKSIVGYSAVNWRWRCKSTDWRPTSSLYWGKRAKVCLISWHVRLSNSRSIAYKLYPRFGLPIFMFVILHVLLSVDMFQQLNSKIFNPATSRSLILLKCKSTLYSYVYPLLICPLALPLPVCTMLVLREVFQKHCQRHNGPEGWVHLAKVILQVQLEISTKHQHLHYTSNSKSWPNLASEYRPRFNFITKHQRQNAEQAPASKSCWTSTSKSWPALVLIVWKKFSFRTKQQLTNL